MHDYYVHPTANISQDVHIGKGTKVWINAQVRENVKIGNDCIISKDTYIDAGVNIGNGCKIQNSVSVYQGVTIEDHVFVGPNVTFTNDRVPRAFLQDWKITPTLIKKGASLGANCTIVCGNTVGEYAMVAAGSVVTRDVEAYTLVMGNPAKFHSYIDKNGNKVSSKEAIHNEN